MKLEVTNENYCATVVSIKTLLELENCDNVLSFPIFWYSAIVSKSSKVWDLGILFPAEVVLYNDYCANNNLFRHSEFNVDKEAKWYIEDNRRVKAMKFRGNKSSALFMPLESLSYLNIPYNSLKEWDSFNEIDGKEICKKYVVYSRSSMGWNKVRWKDKSFERIDNKHFPEHFETSNYWRNKHEVSENANIVVTCKYHWSSWRFGNVLVRRKLHIFERILKYLWVNIQEKEYDYIAWSRRVIKDIKSSNEFQHYYTNDLWNDMLDRIKYAIPKDYIIYWEIVWWAWWSQIQSWYTYDCEQWDNKLLVYRITTINQDWIQTDLWREAIKKFCISNWLEYVHELYVWKHKDFIPEEYMDKRYKDMWYNTLQLSDNESVDEWFVVRVEWLNPQLWKWKSPLFFEYESKQLDSWQEDLESTQS